MLAQWLSAFHLVMALRNFGRSKWFSSPILILLFHCYCENLHSLTINLQEKTIDILAAYEHVPEVHLELELMKSNCEEEFHIWFSDIKTFTDYLNTLLALHKLLQDNFTEQMIDPADSPETYYHHYTILGSHHNRIGLDTFTRQR